MSDETDDILLSIDESLIAELAKYKNAADLARADDVEFDKYLKRVDDSPPVNREQLLARLAGQRDRLIRTQRAALQSRQSLVQAQESLIETLNRRIAELESSQYAPPER